MTIPYRNIGDAPTVCSEPNSQAGRRHQISLTVHEVEHDRARNRIRDTKAGTEIFQRVGEAVEGLDHLAARRDQCIFVRPLPDKAERLVARFDHRAIRQSRPIRLAVPMSIELAAVVELRRHFPGITDNENARLCVPSIAGWKPLPSLPPKEP
jgi:hypothetical protein